MNSEKARILVVDDEPRIADTLAVIFEQAGYCARAVYNGVDALASIAALQAALVISDVVMPGLNGIELAKIIRASYPKCQVLLFSGNADTEQILRMAEQQGHEFEILAKPVPPLQMLAKVASLLNQNPSSLTQ
jgi:DNA-binding NtrC family response regulator